MPKKGTPLIALGLTITGGVWLMSTLAGAITIDKARDKAKASQIAGEPNPFDRDRKRGAALMIPVAGPFMAMPHTDSVTRKYGLALNGSLQIAGLVVALVGIVEQSQYRRARRFGVAAVPDPEGARIAVDVRF
jgi:hypothetical protein